MHKGQVDVHKDHSTSVQARVSGLWPVDLEWFLHFQKAEKKSKETYFMTSENYRKFKLQRP